MYTRFCHEILHWKVSLGTDAIFDSFNVHAMHLSTCQSAKQVSNRLDKKLDFEVSYQS